MFHHLNKLLSNVSVLPALLVLPAFAAAPNTDDVAFLFGDVAITGQSTIDKTAFGGRRMEWNNVAMNSETGLWTIVEEGGDNKYRNEFPNYQMVGRSFSLANSVAYVGPVTLTLRELTEDDHLAYNWAGDGVHAGVAAGEDVDLAAVAGVDFGDSPQNIYTAVANVIGGENAAYTAEGVIAFANLDSSAVAGSLNFNSVNAVVDGATVNADTISVTNGSNLTFVKQNPSSLAGAIDWYTNPADISSTGVTTLNARTINIDGSRMVVDAGAELVINPTENAIFQNNNYTGNGGAVYNYGTLTIDSASFEHNTATGNSGAIAQHDTNSVLNLTNVNFTENSADWGGAIVARGTVNITGGEFRGNTSNDGGGAIYLATLKNKGYKLDIDGTAFVNNSTTGVTVDGGGAIGSFSDLVINNATFTGNSAQGAGDGGAGGAIIMGSVSTNVITGATFSGNTAATSGGAIGTRNFSLGDNKDATLDITGGAFTSNTAATSGGAIDNYFYNDAAGDGYVKVSGSTFSLNSATNGGAIYNHTGVIGDNLIDATHNGRQTAESDPSLIQVGNMYLTGLTFTGNTASEKGGAIYNEGIMTINDTTFINNKAETETVAVNGGAILNDGNITFVGANRFEGNKAHSTEKAAMGGAIKNNGVINGDLSAYFLNNSVVSDANTADGGALYNTGSITTLSGNFEGNSATALSAKNARGGALFAQSSAAQEITTLSSDFSYNSATSKGGNASGGAIYIGGKIGTITGNFDHNSAITTGNGTKWGKGGAIFNDWGTVDDHLLINGSSFTYNTADGTGGASASGGGAIYNNKFLEIENSLFDHNVSATGMGGAIFNNSTLTLTDTSFTNNTSAEGGAIMNQLSKVLNINAVNANVVFSGNTATDGEDDSHDIQNLGVINLNAANGMNISFDGGIDGTTNGTSKGVLNINGAGVVDIAASLKHQTVNVNNGELWLSNGTADAANLTGSTINVASGATIDTIDNLINDYASSIMLSDGAIVKGDLDYTNGLADLYSAVDGATIIYSMANPLDIGIQYGASKTIQVATGNNVTVNAGTGFAWFNSDHGLSLNSSGNADGSIVVTGLAGGINGAVADTDATLHQEIAYLLTDNETFDGLDNVIQKSDFYITGNGNTDGANTLTLANDLVVDSDSSLFIADAFLTKAGDSEKIENRLGAVLNIKDSLIGVDIDNAGTLLSDPTTYTGTINNTGVASFSGDTFASTAVLNNSGTVDLAADDFGNNVTFDNGAQITGMGVTNLISGVVQFNNTASSNTINIANGANFSGVLASTGVINTQNNNIDTITGSVSGGTLNVDANLIGAGSVDTFADATGATISSVNLLASEYGDAQSLTLDVNGAALSDDFVVTGATNYYTNVALDDSGNLVFSDKLLNTSGFYDLVDATWSDGHYILNAATYDAPADETHLTVGDALAELDAQVYANETAISGKVDVTNIYTASVAPEQEIANSDSLVMSVTSFQNSVVNMAENVSMSWAQTQSFENGVTFGENATFGITGAGVATLGATTVSSLTLGNTTTDGIDTTVTSDSNNLITSGAVATALDGKQDAITASNLLAASLIETDDEHTFVTNTQISDWDGKQDAINENNLLSVEYISGLSNVATSGNAADLNTDTSHMFVTNTQISNWNGKQDAITENNLLSAEYISGLSAAATTAIDTTVTSDSNNLITSGAVATALDGKQDAITASNLLAASLIETDSDHQFVTESQIAALDTLTGGGEGSVSNQIQTALNNSGFQDEEAVANAVSSGAQNATYDASADYADGTIGAAIQANAAAIEAFTGTGEGSIASYVEDALNGLDVQTADDVASAVDGNAETATYTANADTHTDGTIGAAIDNNTSDIAEINSVLGRPADDDTDATGLFAEVAAHSDAINTLLSDDENAEGSIQNIAREYVENALALNTVTIDEMAQRDALTLSQANAYTDSRIETLDKNLSSGIASAVALSSVAVGGVRRGEMSVGAGYGYFNGQSAAAFGAALGLSSRWSINAGAGVSGYDVSFRAGTNYKFKVF